MNSADTFERPIYAGNAIATVQSSDAVKIITVRTTAFDTAAATGGSAAVESVPVVAASGKSRFVGQELAKSDRPDLTAAKVVVSGSRRSRERVVRSCHVRIPAYPNRPPSPHVPEWGFPTDERADVCHLRWDAIACP